MWCFVRYVLITVLFLLFSVIGVVQMVNKLNGVFTKADEESFETFSIYCGLALHHAKVREKLWTVCYFQGGPPEGVHVRHVILMLCLHHFIQLYEKIRRSEQKYKVALEVLSYHSQAPDDEITKLRALQMPDNLPSLTGWVHFNQVLMWPLLKAWQKRSHGGWSLVRIINRLISYTEASRRSHKEGSPLSEGRGTTAYFNTFLFDCFRYHFSPWAVTNDEKPLYVIYMFRDLFNSTR